MPGFQKKGKQNRISAMALLILTILSLAPVRMV